MADITEGTTVTETAQVENNGGDPTQAVSSEKGEKAVSASEGGTLTEKTSNAEGTKSPDKTEEKKFSQSEVDDMISKRLEREKKNAEKAAAEKSAESAKETEALKQSLACYKAGVREDCIEDAVTLAGKLVNDKTDFSAALKKVIEKYPSFVGGQTKGTGVPMDNKDFSSSDAALRKAFGLKEKK